jgi:hypothetical protein
MSIIGVSSGDTMPNPLGIFKGLILALYSTGLIRYTNQKIKHQQFPVDALFGAPEEVLVSFNGFTGCLMGELALVILCSLQTLASPWWVLAHPLLTQPLTRWSISPSQ